ncbi:MAG TPA: PaaI family thioesterase [Caulobacteraceae bacterium]|jgi:uncharacterized protein (TIGR00369 family)|nr:PaaI family thioesterase [Caulobacteraceae bacterium]
MSLSDAPTGTVFDNFPKPPCAQLLGWTLLEHDAVRGWARIGFEGRPEFLNPAGSVQGGLLAAMLDDAMGPPALLMSEGAFYTATIDMNVSFLAPARPGRFIAEGQVVQMGKTVAFLEARLFDGDGTLVAKASSSARLVPTSKLPSPA